MSFNELISVEHFIIHQLTGVNPIAKGKPSEPQIQEMTAAIIETT